jgi:hypothetical protein
MLPIPKRVTVLCEFIYLKVIIFRRCVFENFLILFSNFVTIVLQQDGPEQGGRKKKEEKFLC